MLKQENYIKSVRHLRGKDLKISLSRVITSETAQLNYLLDKTLCLVAAELEKVTRPMIV